MSDLNCLYDADGDTVHYEILPETVGSKTPDELYARLVTLTEDELTSRAAKKAETECKYNERWAKYNVVYKPKLIPMFKILRRMNEVWGEQFRKTDSDDGWSLFKSAHGGISLFSGECGTIDLNPAGMNNIRFMANGDIYRDESSSINCSAYELHLPAYKPADKDSFKLVKQKDIMIYIFDELFELVDSIYKWISMTIADVEQNGIPKRDLSHVSAD